MFRVLVPGGRIGITDVVAEGHLTAVGRAAAGSYVGCIVGALSRTEYLDGLAAAGFTKVPKPVTNQGKYGPLRGAMPGMKLGAGRGLRVVCRGSAGWGWAEGACWVWRAVRRHRVTLDRSRP
jgi:hypothetical protein